MLEPNFIHLCDVRKSTCHVLIIVSHVDCIIHVWIHRWTFQRTMAVMLIEQNVSVFLHHYRQHHFIPSSYHLPGHKDHISYILIRTPCTHNIIKRYMWTWIIHTIPVFFRRSSLFFFGFHRKIGEWFGNRCHVHEPGDRKPEFEPAK